MVSEDCVYVCVCVCVCVCYCVWGVPSSILSSEKRHVAFSMKFYTGLFRSIWTGIAELQSLETKWLLVTAYCRGECVTRGH